MPSFLILARKRWGEKLTPVQEYKGCEDTAVDVAQALYRSKGMNRVVVADDKFKIVFKLDRRCRCLNCQYEIDGKLRCIDCRRVVE